MKFYIDTSVFGGLFDEEFEKDTNSFFEHIKQKNIKVIYSKVLKGELEKAPDKVRAVFDTIQTVEYAELTEDALELAEVYIEEGALGAKSFNDAQHIAIATVSRANVIISWNFRHMVNFLKIRQYNSINLREGYGMINIYTPRDVVSMEYN